VAARTPVKPILIAGLACGLLDITAAIVVYGRFGAKPLRILQGIAGGLLGPRAHDGGLATAALGLLCHFVIATTVAAVYFAASRRLRWLVTYAVPSGVLYGIAVYFFMNRIVVPLSAARKPVFSLRMMFIGLAIHIACVGLPIALVVRAWERRYGRTTARAVARAVPESSSIQ
jgi:asparagine N-glycosylation enzyme membrane subunit Stt3